MTSHGPIVASTNLSPALFQSLYENLGGSFNAKKRSGDQDEGQRKNHAHLGKDASSSLSSTESLDSKSSTQAAAAAAGTTVAGNPKKKPGRKPATTEPANKRTAQNRAAQRAFRERKERYVKELEERLAQLEEAQEKSEGGELVGENSRLRQKIAELENENRVLRQMPFAFEFPGQQNGMVMSNEKLNDATNGAAYDINDYRFTATNTSPGLTNTSSSYAPISPTSIINAEGTPYASESSPFSNNSGDMPALLEGDSYALFDDVQSSTHSVISEHETASINDQSDLDSILAGLPLDQFTFTDQLPNYSTQADFTNNFAAAPFQSYRDTNPFSATFNNPFTTDTAIATDAEFDEFLSLTGAERPMQQQQQQQLPQAQLPVYQHPSPQQFQQQTQQQLQQLQQQLPTYVSPLQQQPSSVPQPNGQKHNIQSVKCPLDAETWKRTKDCVEDPQSIDELCDLFKTKAQCSEMVQLQNQILTACENGKKDEVMDLLLVAKEKKRMHMLRMKAGVTVLPPGLDAFI
ncbi:hypothetical protein PhCBS80983_g02786 [Powellomyces hirtus]|uniref:BZIP domain-containing protein n=1 Tax=Powellomyces hirtus TaxID=109895 RepID=A0A507E6I4_9FUNG|nr:hypothetical protein PhCBS80983_g02786 [Powellomyces hirtus]